MGIKDKVKRFWKMMTVDPNSPEGLRMRADRLIEQGFSPQNPMVAALVKQADLKEMEERKKSDQAG